MDTLQVQVVRHHCEDDGACFGGAVRPGRRGEGGKGGSGGGQPYLDYISKYSREDMQAQIREPEAKETWQLDKDDEDSPGVTRTFPHLATPLQVVACPPDQGILHHLRLELRTSESSIDHSTISHRNLCRQRRLGTLALPWCYESMSDPTLPPQHLPAIPSQAVSTAFQLAAFRERPSSFRDQFPQSILFLIDFIVSFYPTPRTSSSSGYLSVPKVAPRGGTTPRAGTFSFPADWAIDIKALLQFYLDAVLVLGTTLNCIRSVLMHIL
ncbi:hypothetical protein DTO169C6_3612 [Paecilomyces variotii]|nr:hypothetical protein DTO169C6_3612 [Paecilomyces variotii]